MGFPGYGNILFVDVVSCENNSFLEKNIIYLSEFRLLWLHITCKYFMRSFFIFFKLSKLVILVQWRWNLLTERWKWQLQSHWVLKQVLTWRNIGSLVTSILLCVSRTVNIILFHLPKCHEFEAGLRKCHQCWLWNFLWLRWKNNIMCSLFCKTAI